jgi:hypothetical protein
MARKAEVVPGAGVEWIESHGGFERLEGLVEAPGFIPGEGEAVLEFGFVGLECGGLLHGGQGVVGASQHAEDDGQFM